MPVRRVDSESDARLEERGLAFLHQARRVRDLDSARVERIARRLRRRAARPRRMLLWPVLAAFAMLAGVGTAFAVAKGRLSALPLVGVLFSPKASVAPNDRHARPRALPKQATTETAPAALHPSETGPAPVQRLAPDGFPAPPTVPAPSQSPGSTRPSSSDSSSASSLFLPSAGGSKPAESGRRAADRTPVRPIELAHAEAAVEPIVAESRVFARVIDSWRRQHDAAASLALLVAYERRYPTGHMHIEARALRAEIYLAQNRDDAALSVLDGLSLTGLPRARELATVRGELRVKAGRCREARADLSIVLEVRTTDTLGQRATRALAHCP